MMILLMLTVSSLKPKNSLSLLQSPSCLKPRGISIISLLAPSLLHIEQLQLRHPRCHPPPYYFRPQNLSKFNNSLETGPLS
ncbi:hypothetical protein E2C01_071863 [Portunus trituberculatus]|uniref:Uncharacterized protein n=1 Tax=Portunus trituberculatus TaxID=210409 RepID=A0A5B7HY50_PORTR|nr:hypothetical protein [Portunus trituberculatus]